jgi:hypothetical protein
MVDCPPKRGGDPLGNFVGSLGSGRASIFDNQIGYIRRRGTVSPGASPRLLFCRSPVGRPRAIIHLSRYHWRIPQSRLPAFSSYPSFKTSGRLEIRESADQLLAPAWKTAFGPACLSCQCNTPPQGGGRLRPAKARHNALIHNDLRRRATAAPKRVKREIDALLREIFEGQPPYADRLPAGEGTRRDRPSP